MQKSTEEKIKEAARKIFLERGFSGARIRDIAKEAGINLALVNYHYQSKESLFKLIMEEQIDELFGAIIPILDRKDTTLEEKIEEVIQRYFEMLIKVPELPLFVISELRDDEMNPNLLNRLKKILEKRELEKNLRDLNPNLNIYHILMNFIGLIIFPFISKPIFVQTGFINEDEFKKLIETQKQILPQLINGLSNISL